MYHVTSVVRGLVLMAVMIMAMTSTLLADGNETLGPPSISIAAGSGYVSAGVGLSQSQPGIININVPAGATVNQVLIYWEGQYTTANGDDAITVGGNNVSGTLIGGPDYFFSNNGGTLPVYSSTYRADITSLALVSAGANAISVADLDNDIANNGAGIFVIYSDGLPNTEIQLVDGNDLAYKFFPNPRGTMVAQTFTFTAASTPRTAKLSMFFSSVQGILSTGGVLRPNQITVTVGATVTTFTDELLSNDGQEWDTMTKLINIPAGETQLTVLAESGPGGDEDPNTVDPKPASFAWNAAGLSIQCTGKIGDFVFKDANCDGNQSGDTGIPNVIVTLKQGNTVLATTTTDANGHYEFDGLCLGEYTVEVDATSLPAGYTPTTCSNTPGIGDNSNCSPSTVVLTENNTEDLTIDFGYCEPPPPCTGKIGNFVWKDSDCDGTQEAGEPGIANVTVQLLDAAGVNVLKTTTTNASGYYLFDSLCADAYTVKVVAATLPAGYTPTTCSNVANNNTNSNCSPSPVVLVNNNSEDLTIDFGYCAPPECSGKIGNFVWKDLNCNGTQNAGEPGIANVVVKLYRGATLVKTTTTDASGYYSFDSLCADCYTVKVDATTLPAGYTPTTCSNVANNNTNSNCSPAQVVLVNNNSQDLTIDFGYCATGGQGCTPGYWKQCQHFDSWPSGLTPSTKFSSVATGFENAFPNKTLLQVLNLNGTSKLGQLGFHTVAALLSSKKVNYAFTPAQVVSMFNNVYPGTDAAYEALKNIFAAANERGCPLNRVGVAEDETVESYALLQNYPNPFNPSTEIYFQIPLDSKVTLKVYNTLGQEVRTLIDDQLAAGAHGAMWDARDNNGNAVSSGVYFYRLVAGEHVSMKKMSLLK